MEDYDIQRNKKFWGRTDSRKTLKTRIGKGGNNKRKTIFLKRKGNRKLF